MTPNPAAERRNNVSHGREPVEKVILREFQPHRGGTVAASCVVPPGLDPWQFSVHGLTPVASVVSPLRGWFRLNRISSSDCFSGIRSGGLKLRTTVLETGTRAKAARLHTWPAVGLDHARKRQDPVLRR